jgi:hypothetical protein
MIVGADDDDIRAGLRGGDGAAQEEKSDRDRISGRRQRS